MEWENLTFFLLMLERDPPLSDIVFQFIVLLSESDFNSINEKIIKSSIFHQVANLESQTSYRRIPVTGSSSNWYQIPG